MEKRSSWKRREFEVHPTGLPEVEEVPPAITGQQIKAGVDWVQSDHLG